MTESTSATTVPAEAIDAVDFTMPEATQKPTGTEGQKESLLVSWKAPDGSIAGVWECSPGTFTSQKAGVFEVSQVLSGRATVTSADGSVLEVSAGSLVILPDGWVGEWQVHETIRKSYTIVPTASQ
jgi:uncharacterized cupin superfamily protein